MKLGTAWNVGDTGDKGYIVLHSRKQKITDGSINIQNIDNRIRMYAPGWCEVRKRARMPKIYQIQTKCQPDAARWNKTSRRKSLHGKNVADGPSRIYVERKRGKDAVRSRSTTYK